MTRRCPQCGDDKPLDAEHFYRNRANAAGYCSQCKTCDSIRRKAVAHRYDYREDRKQRGRARSRAMTRLSHERPDVRDYLITVRGLSLRQAKARLTLMDPDRFTEILNEELQKEHDRHARRQSLQAAA